MYADYRLDTDLSYIGSQEWPQALQLLSMMRVVGCPPDEVTYGRCLSSLALGALVLPLRIRHGSQLMQSLSTPLRMIMNIYIYVYVSNSI